MLMQRARAVTLGLQPEECQVIKRGFMVTVKVCPKCGSENVKVDPTNVRSAVGLSQPYYLCLDCGFSGQFFPEIDRDVPKIE